MTALLFAEKTDGIEAVQQSRSDAYLSAIVLTYNEEANLPACLESLRGLPCAVFVVDSGSSDGTREVAARFGATFVEHAFQTHSTQWQWALTTLPLRTEWILALDADQRVTPELASELSRLDVASLEDVDGLFVKRRQIFRNRWIRHGGYYPEYLLKVFRRSRVVVHAGDLVDHHFYVPGPVRKLSHDIIESNSKEDDISFWVDKHNRYSTLLAREELRARVAVSTPPIKPSLFGNPDQRSLALKLSWRRMPLFARPFIYFVYRYVLRFGFLDGKQGAIFHFLQAFWFRLLVDIKLDELLNDARHGLKPDCVRQTPVPPRHYSDS